MKKFLLLGCVMSTAFGQTAFAQVNVVREPLPEYQSIDEVPLEYTDDGIMKAQHIRPGDISPEEYQALLEEAERVRAYRSRDAGAGTISSATEYDYGYDYNIQSENTGQGRVVDVELPPYTEPQYEMLPSAQPDSYSRASSPSYYVLKGDTLFGISRKFGVSVADLKRANALADNIIQPGQFLSIPGRMTTASNQTPDSSQNTVVSPYNNPTAPTYARSTDPIMGTARSSGVYAVLPGDTLYSISRRACVRVDHLQAQNSFLDANNLQPGQRLTMPSGHCL